MTEAEWLTGEDSRAMSLHIVKGSARKLRLFAVACARRVPAELINEDCRKLLEASEASAEDLIKPPARRKLEKPVAALAQQHEEAWRKALHAEDWTSADYRRYKAISACGMTSQADRFMMRLAADEAANATLDPAAERRYHCHILRCIYGNPFQPATFQAAWQTPETLALASQIETSFAAADYARLADALVRAGCTDDAVLAHCRSGAQHFRGCWIIDLIQGKK